jgi:hypothetical protein
MGLLLFAFSEGGGFFAGAEGFAEFLADFLGQAPNLSRRGVGESLGNGEQKVLVSSHVIPLGSRGGLGKRYQGPVT